MRKLAEISMIYVRRNNLFNDERPMFFQNKKAKELLMQLVANDEPKIDHEGIGKMEENIAKAKK